MTTPILLITFNRPNHTRRVLERILEAKPQELYVFQDGAREGNANDAAKCAEVRQVIDTLWNNYLSQAVAENEKQQPHLHRYYSDINLGCGPGPMTGITWFFEQVEQGIIIEDDCILSASGFRFYEELLEQYKNEEKISAITATNLHLKWRSKRSSYLFSTVGAGTLGCWATWARAWEKFDYHINAWQQSDVREQLKENFVCREYYDYYAQIFDECSKPQSHMWDYQWFFAKILANTYTIVASLNQVSNIGFDPEGTHTQATSRLANFPLFEMAFPMEDMSVKRDWLFDWVVFQRYYSKKKKYLWKRVLLKIIDVIYRK